MELVSHRSPLLEVVGLLNGSNYDATQLLAVVSSSGPITLGAIQNARDASLMTNSVSFHENNLPRPHRCEAQPPTASRISLPLKISGSRMTTRALRWSSEVSTEKSLPSW